ncbi:hypothetical protein HPB48_018482 [Haemaphysalis longicornis]|uniref:Uncharacterized protein n=1 Tax=Haemaphysalis longicornis TaxID=44386 RepID=A0A9J6FV65_HAELO|nr:hypothetical protein HPB48_018482 [Haemaphysalis longicornis]
MQRLPMKDFGAEVRASMDVDQFLIQAVLLLDVQETSLEGIVDKMLQKVRVSTPFHFNPFELVALPGRSAEDSQHQHQRSIRLKYSVLTQ